ncbi:STAS domain-containing protein [Actinoplanes sp. NBRC 101535]|uniref:STAS domain-containing protein n=1 Tax=Actinoplanes sp. NBRC 101535 TaxID=3032196 RepID=UPI0024A5C5C4|nr:STAS domain-containing protein [Actinoplanes sp. NBRC 101535]GLY03211.1 ATP-binding protein [Actinoplanes sp. NBRC 101535]
MIAPLHWTVDERDAGIVVAVTGILDIPATPRLHQALLRCLAEQPHALLVDMSAMTLADDTMLALFTAVTRQAARWPGTPVLLCAPSEEAAALLLRGRYGMLVVHPDLAVGLAAVTAGRVTVPSMTDRLLPVSGAARRARDLVTEACAAWDLPGLIAPASLVTSELVSNGVEHASTMLTLQISHRSRHVHVAVRDGSSDAPFMSTNGDVSALRGRGLRLVEAVSTRWGWLPTTDGKVVWAALATD